MHPRSASGFVLCLYIGLVLGGLVSIGGTQAQEYINLVSFTNTWRYNQAGQNLGTNWIAPDYDDTVEPWQSGPALLAKEDIPLPGNYSLATLVFNTIPTPLSLTGEGGTNGTNITFYFRTRFTNAVTNPAGVELWATNLVDDGCVIYLNGARAGDVRLTNASPGFVTFANGGPATEGQLDPVRLPIALLVPGENTLAVEVHQVAVNSADVAFALRLMAIIAHPLVITSQPPATLGVIVGRSLEFTVGVSGGPALYQWQRNGATISGATNATLSIPTAAVGHAGEYRCIVSNSINTVTSQTAVVSVVQDLIGPRALEARVLETGVTNIIQIIFDESMHSTTTSPNRNADNYRVVASGTTDNFVSITNLQISGSFILLRVNTASNWVIGNGYYVVMNNLVDVRTNVIAPSTVVPISWPRRFNLLASDAVWSFHAAAVFDSAVYNEDWTSPEYTEGPWWAAGPGLFYGGPGTVPQCLGPAQTLVGYQPEPILFRTTFQWPADLGAVAQLTASRAIDDGLILYLNGQEIQRVNVTGPIGPWTRSSTNVPNATCHTNNVNVAVTNLRPGTNWLAAALVQSPVESDVVFGLRLSATVFLPSPVPDNSPPVLALSPHGMNATRLSWTGYGYALETTTNLFLGSDSYPNGPWLPVPSMSNPYTNSLANPERYFRLKK